VDKDCPCADNGLQTGFTALFAAFLLRPLSETEPSCCCVRWKREQRKEKRQTDRKKEKVEKEKMKIKIENEK